MTSRRKLQGDFLTLSRFSFAQLLNLFILGFRIRIENTIGRDIAASPRAPPHFRQERGFAFVREEGDFPNRTVEGANGRQAGISSQGRATAGIGPRHSTRKRRGTAKCSCSCHIFIDIGVSGQRLGIEISVKMESAADLTVDKVLNFIVFMVVNVIVVIAAAASLFGYLDGQKSKGVLTRDATRDGDFTRDSSGGGSGLSHNCFDNVVRGKHFLFVYG
mmetsp:Transcript_1861/g.4160  ORF Transcript_1861/g.4160 Transcript_1861/m.4160 type:complete len:218 (-) Transcript_1861:4-657(-)